MHKLANRTSDTLQEYALVGIGWDLLTDGQKGHEDPQQTCKFEFRYTPHRFIMLGIIAGRALSMLERESVNAYQEH